MYVTQSVKHNYNDLTWMIQNLLNQLDVFD